ncbi:MAG: RNA polymerase sigma factor, partial [Acidobacteria bacterium]|nr:RNA polymerase sigma factor [Acidobacteriota bacterium]
AQLRTIHRSSALEAEITELFKLLWAPLVRYLVGIVGSHAEAEELAQEAFLALYSCLRKGKAIGNCRAWVFRVAHNMAINLQQRKGTHGSQSHPVDWDSIRKESADPNENAEQRIILRERQAKVQAALKTLSPQERQCLGLRAEGLRFREIAEILSLRIPTVETFIDRSIRKVMKAIYGYD